MTASDSGIAAGNVRYAETTSTSKKASEKVSEKALTARERIQREDEVRLSKCGYKQVRKKQPIISASTIHDFTFTQVCHLKRSHVRLS
jgi:hypothetical protein